MPGITTSPPFSAITYHRCAPPGAPTCLVLLATSILNRSALFLSNPHLDPIFRPNAL